MHPWNFPRRVGKAKLRGLRLFRTRSESYHVIDTVFDGCSGGSNVVEEDGELREVDAVRQSGHHSPSWPTHVFADET